MGLRSLWLRRRLAGAFCLALAGGCLATVENPPTSPVVREPASIPVSVAAPDATSSEVMSLFVGVGRLLGYPVELVVDGSEVGAVTVLLHEAGPMSTAAGYALVTDGCRRGVWAEPRDYVVAHELGHALGLKHELIVGNLMFPLAHPLNVELSEEQSATIRENLIELSLCAQ